LSSLKGPILALVDLDDSLFQSLGKCRSTDSLTPAALDRKGEPLSFMEGSQRLLWDLLAKAVVVPVTARNLSSLRRVSLKFKAGAIVSFGGLIVRPDGAIDQQWRDEISPKALRARDFLAEAWALTKSLIKVHRLAARVKIISDDSLDFFLVVKTAPAKLRELNFLRDELTQAYPNLGRIFLNGHNLSLLPNYLGKAKAVQYFIQRLWEPDGDERLVLGLGDSLADREFLALCDYILTPSRGQLAKLWP
jgi:hydroxymethylpyrimidine pyrophosphatase-like HAD family hydrolase